MGVRDDQLGWRQRQRREQPGLRQPADRDPGFERRLGTTFTVSGSHVYADEGTYKPTLTISDAGGSATTTTAGTTIVKVADARLANGTATYPYSQQAGQYLDNSSSSSQQVLAEFTSADAIATASEFSATINWGDGRRAGVPAP